MYLYIKMIRNLYKYNNLFGPGMCFLFIFGSLKGNLQDDKDSTGK